MTSTTKIKFTRDGDAYKFGCERFTANIWKFESAYGDTQWGCDIEWQDGRTITAEYSQFDYLENVRNWIGYLVTEVK